MERSQLETYEDRVPRTAFDFHLLYLVSLKDFFLVFVVPNTVTEIAGMLKWLRPQLLMYFWADEPVHESYRGEISSLNRGSFGVRSSPLPDDHRAPTSIQRLVTMKLASVAPIDWLSRLVYCPEHVHDRQSLVTVTGESVPSSDEDRPLIATAYCHDRPDWRRVVNTWSASRATWNAPTSRSARWPPKSNRSISSKSSSKRRSTIARTSSSR